MTYKVSDTFKSLSQQINKQPMIILEIEGSANLYGSAKILETARWDDPRINWDNTDGVTWDGEIEKDNSKPYILLHKSSTTKRISQQLLVDKGGSGSITTMDIELLDYKSEVARDLSFNNIGEPIGKRSTIYFGWEGGKFPQDFVEILKGQIDDITYNAGSISVSTALSINTARQSMLEQYQSETTSVVKFKTLTIQDIFYAQRSELLLATARIRYVNGGALAVARSGDDITVTIVAGVTLAKDIVDEISNSAETNSYIEASVVGDKDAIQTAVGYTTVETDTTINVETEGGLFASQDALISHIRIDDEIMEVTNIAPGVLTVVRGALGTLANSHDDEAEVTSYYILNGHPIDLSLKMLHSSEGNEFEATSYRITALNRIDTTTLITGAIVVDQLDIEAKLGLVPGDLINLIGTASNDGLKVIESFGVTDTGKSYIVVEGGLTEETGLDLALNVKSKYNVLPDGAGMRIDQVDTATFEYTKALYSASFIDYSFKLTETVGDVRDFIIKEVFKPQGLYMIPRKAKTSCKYTAPPFSVDALPVLNTQTLYDLTQIKMRRSTHQYLYNSVLYRYNRGVLEDKFFDKSIFINADSKARIPVGKKRLEIDVIGLGRSTEVVQTLERVGSRILNRYKFGARYISNVKVMPSIGVVLEIGDIIFFGGEDTQLVNLETGERDNPLAQYEVINKEFDIAAGEVILTLLETGFGVDGIFGVFSPASGVGAGSTVDRILVKDLWASDQYSKERDKWNRWEGLKVRVRSADYTYDETTTFDRLDSATNEGLILDPPLPAAPLEDYIIELAKYEEYGANEPDFSAKLTYTFTMPSAYVDTVTDDKTFDLLPADITKYSVGMEVQLHSDDYTRDSETRIIDDITGNTITLDVDLDITPIPGDRLEVYSYGEEKGYRFL